MSGEPASVRVLQRIELCDTDVTGHYHHSTVIRWVEAAEQTLLHRLGLDHLPIMPRVHYSASYRRRLWRHEVVETRLRVAEVGRSSMRYLFDVCGSDGPSVDGTLTVVKVEVDSGSARPWSDQERKVLLESGPQEDDPLHAGPARTGLPRTGARRTGLPRVPAQRGPFQGSVPEPAAHPVAALSPSAVRPARPTADAWGIGFG
ncbi:acyl-CoA thioesterase [Actinomadura kijaniata]|uniref:acyl-CoA thioesterase n=1 Tax=Actinomadura kijaniata TaxID=46161 RepID=UPI003F194870